MATLIVCTSHTNNGWHSDHWFPAPLLKLFSDTLRQLLMMWSGAEAKVLMKFCFSLDEHLSNGIPSWLSWPLPGILCPQFLPLFYVQCILVSHVYLKCWYISSFILYHSIPDSPVVRASDSQYEGREFKSLFWIFLNFSTHHKTPHPGSTLAAR